MRQIEIGKTIGVAKGSVVLVDGEKKTLAGAIYGTVTEAPLTSLRGRVCIPVQMSDTVLQACLFIRRVVRPGRLTCAGVPTDAGTDVASIFDASVPSGALVEVLPSALIDSGV